VCLTIAANGLNLLVPRIIARGIDAFDANRLVSGTLVAEFIAVAFGVFAFTYVQSVVQAFASERVARDLRAQLVKKLAMQDVSYIQQVTTARLLTNLTSDVDAVKLFVSQVVGTVVSSAFLILGASVLLLSINWRLALAVLAVLPVITVTFQAVQGRVRKLFIDAQGTLDWLNKVINETILGAPLIRLLDSQQTERDKFLNASTEAREIGLRVLRLYAGVIPVVVFCFNLATLMIVTLGGRFVIVGRMSLGEFAAFNSYLAILAFPVLLISFMTTVMAQSSAAYMRVGAVLAAAPPRPNGRVVADLRGGLALSHIVVKYGERATLKDVTISVAAGTKTAIIGPTAAGKTQLLYLLAGLLAPTSGRIEYDGTSIDDYDKTSLHQQVAFVFQDATIFNLTLRENIAFSNAVTGETLEKAIQTAELTDFIGSLPQGLETLVSERGTSLSGGQKQRIMLARALAINPRVLLLDDFTARVDLTTERNILENIRRNYPSLTLVSVTQKIAPIQDYDQIVLIVEGEVLGCGTHQELLAACPEYVQIYESQRSTSHYEPVPA